jgi:hypothetical protein
MNLAVMADQCHQAGHVAPLDMSSHDLVQAIKPCFRNFSRRHQLLSGRQRELVRTGLVWQYAARAPKYSVDGSTRRAPGSIFRLASKGAVPIIGAEIDLDALDPVAFEGEELCVAKALIAVRSFDR